MAELEGVPAWCLSGGLARNGEKQWEHSTNSVAARREEPQALLGAFQKSGEKDCRAPRFKTSSWTLL